MKNIELGTHVLSLIETKGGFSVCKDKYLFSKIAKTVAQWCLNKTDPSLRNAARPLFGTTGGHHIKLIYCWMRDTNYQTT